MGLLFFDSFVEFEFFIFCNFDLFGIEIDFWVLELFELLGFLKLG